MKKKTAKALEGSIRKWKKIVKGTGQDLGIEDCPLCHAFIDDDCKGCPVAKKAKMAGCLGTPHTEYLKSKSSSSAKKMLKFLKSLREK